MVTVEEARSANYVEAIPAPIQPLNTFPPQVAVHRSGIGNASDSNAGQLCCSRIRGSLKLERIQIRYLGQPGKGTEVRWIDVLEPDINAGGRGRTTVDKGDKDSLDVSLGVS